MRTGSRTTLAVISLFIASTAVSLPVARASHEGYTLNVTPEMSTNPLRQPHKLTATVAPAVQGPPVEVNFEIVQGPNAFQTCCDDTDDGQTGTDDMSRPDMSCLINAAETSCTATYSDTRAAPGEQDRILAWIDHDNTSTVSLDGIDLDESHDAGEPPHEPGVKNGSAGSQPEPDATDVVIKNWGQLQVGQIPYTDGFVEAFEVACDTQRRRVDGAVIGVARVCTYMVAMDPSQENDSESDHFALWTQATGEAKGKGWCATRLTTTTKVPSAGELTAFAALPETEPTGRELLSAVLTFDANGTAVEPAYIEASAFAAEPVTHRRGE